MKEDGEKEISQFLDMLRADMGFMIFDDDEKYLLSKKSWKADEFVQELFKLLKLNPEYDLSLYRQVRRKFIDRFGNEL